MSSRPAIHHTARTRPFLRTLAFAMQPALLVALSACASTRIVPPRSDHTRPTHQRPVRQPPVRQPTNRPAPPARLTMERGLEGVIGAGLTDVSRQFGDPRLDVWEGDARKLQFTGTACVLDVYFYPQGPGGALIATYVDARRTDGRDVDKAACVAALRR